MNPPSIDNSTRDERLAFIREAWKCLADCDMCGKCQMLHNKDAEDVFADYIEGLRSYLEISKEIRR